MLVERFSRMQCLNISLRLAHLIHVCSHRRGTTWDMEIEIVEVYSSRSVFFVTSWFYLDWISKNLSCTGNNRSCYYLTNRCAALCFIDAVSFEIRAERHTRKDRKGKESTKIVLATKGLQNRVLESTLPVDASKTIKGRSIHVRKATA